VIFVSVTRHVLTYLGRPGRREDKVMTLAANEFIRRFLLHVLPDGFHRMRHYGFLANGGCSRTKDSFRAADFGTRRCPNL
jgi:hypothetical protein